MASPHQVARPQLLEPSVLGERDRPTRELHNEVIQRIFAIGLTMQGAAALAVDPLVRRKIEKTISDTEAVVQIIRDTVSAGPTQTTKTGAATAPAANTGCVAGCGGS